MQKTEVSSLLDKMNQALRSLRDPVIATDADGTLWSGDVGTDAFEALLHAGGVRLDALAPLRRIAREHGVQANGEATGIARALYEAFQRGAFPEPLCYEVMAWAFAGFSVDEAREFVRGVQRATLLGSRMHGEMKRVVAWAKEQRVPIVVVSASPSFVVECGVELLGLEARDVIGTAPGVQDGVIQATLAAPMPYGETKVTALRAAVTSAPVLAAFGDNVFDLPMLRLASLRVAVRPKGRLRAAALGTDGLLELAAEES